MEKQISRWKASWTRDGRGSIDRDKRRGGRNAVDWFAVMIAGDGIEDVLAHEVKFHGINGGLGYQLAFLTSAKLVVISTCRDTSRGQAMTKR